MAFLIAPSASDRLKYCWRSSGERVDHRERMIYLRLTSYLRFWSIVQFGEHDLECFDRFIIALCAMKRCMLQLISKIG